MTDEGQNNKTRRELIQEGRRGQEEARRARRGEWGSVLSRRELTARRWGYVLVLSLMGGLIALVLFALRVSALQKFLKTNLWVVGAGGAATLCFVLQAAWLARPGRTIDDETQGAYSQYTYTDRFCAYFGLKHFLRYPPVWVAGCFGAAILIGVIGFSSSLRLVLNLDADLSWGLRRTALAYGAGPLLVGIAAGAGQSLRSRILRHRGTQGSAASEVKQDAAQDQPLSSWKQLRTWLLQDAPVVRRRDDAFGHAVVARRIAKRLQENPIPPQVVVGALGTGKTTLRHLVEAELGPSSTTHILSIELWPYDTPEAAVAGVLRTLLQRVARETNVLSARGLPESYIAAMSAAGGFSARLASLAEKPKSPFDVLDAIDRIAMTIGHQFVVWVEDLERFAHASGGGESLEHSERLAPLRALLFGLSQLKAVSVVTATVELHARFDTEKIARYVEELPALEYADTARILRMFRSGCLNRQFIDPAAPDARKDWESFDSNETAELRDILGEEIHSLPDAAVFLCRTPRRLKLALRKVLFVWDTLTGEIDFDDLLVMHLLREAEPGVFAVVQARWDALTGNRIAQTDRMEDRDAFRSALSTLALQGNRAKAVDVIVENVLLAGDRPLKPQGLNIRRYWKRFLAEPDIPPEDLDQPVLQTLDRGDNDAVLTLLEGAQSAQVEHFSRRIPAERLLRLLAILILRRAPEDPSGWFKPGEWQTGDPPGMLPLWRMLRRARESGALNLTEVYDVLIAVFDLAITNLHLVSELEYHFAGATQAKNILCLEGSAEGQQLAESARQHLWRLLVDTYVNDPIALIRALRGAPKWTLARVVWGSARIHLKEYSNIPFADWSRLAQTILDACDQAPELMLPQLAALVTREAGHQHDDDQLRRIQEFDQAQARMLFGDEHAILRRYRCNVPVMDSARDVMDAMIDAARSVGDDDDEESGDG